MQLNKNILNVPYSIIRDITEKAKKINNSIILAIGEPDLEPPKELVKYASEYALNNSLPYTSAGGDESIRDLTAKHYNKYYNSNINANNVTMHIGSMEGISSIFRTILNIDDEVIIPMPFFSPYEDAVKLSYGKPVFIDTKEDNFVLKPHNIEKAITNKTKAILFSNPCNPSGYMLKKDEIDELVKYFETKDIFIISDEIYSSISFYTFISFASYESIKEKVIVLNGFSKSHSMTGWRIGYSISHENVRKYLLNASFNNVGSMVTLSCAACEYALKNYPIIEEFTNIYKERAFYMFKELSDLGFDCIEPRGAFYLFAGYSKFSNENSIDFCMKLLEKTGVAIVPGKAFGNEGYFRIALTKDISILKEAVKRIKEFVSN